MGYTHGTKWTDEAIKDGIMNVVNGFELDRMPSRAEVRRYYNDERLTNAITKRPGGWARVASELGLKIKESETYFGKRHEHIAGEKLKSIGYEVVQMPQNFPYDLLINDAIKLDVKVSRLYRGKHGNFYSFNLEKPYTTCDILLLITLEDNNAIKDYYIVPSAFVPKNSQISMGQHKSKYDKYKDRWDYLERYDKFINQEIIQVV